jgi:predicted transposase YdaD
MAQQIDHDGSFKILLTTFFREFLALFAPRLEERLTPEPLIFLDKEHFVNLLDPDRREADVLVQAHLEGEPATFLIHLEHQAQSDKLLDRRMFRYFARFYDFYNTPIYPIALCSYTTPRQPAASRHQVVLIDQIVLHFQYQVVQLNRLDWRDYLQSDNPVAAALMARMPVANADRWRVKAACMRLLAGQQLNGTQRRLIGQFVDQYLPLNKSQEAAFRAEVANFRPSEREAVMEIVTSWERRARAEGRLEGRKEGRLEGHKEGRKEGRKEGQRELVQKLLVHKFGTLPAELVSQFEQLSLRQLNSLATALLELADIAALQNWFAAHKQTSSAEGS